MAQALWQFFLADSATMTRIADISHEVRDKSFQLALNRPGSFSWNMPMSTEWADYLVPSKHCIIASKNKTVVWSGPIWTKSEKFAAEKIDLSAAGWFQFLMKRYLEDASHTWSDTNEGQIAFNLLAHANAQVVEGSARPTWITAGTNTSTGTRTRTYERWQNIGQEIVALTDIESGFDFTIDPITREMNITNWDDYTDSTDAVFGFNFGPSNVNDVTRDTNADDMGNQYYVAGQYGIAEAHDQNTTHLAEYGVHQQVLNINEISDTNILGAIANAELAVNELPRVIINFDPKGEGIVNVPSLFEDYNLGDKVYLTAKRDEAEVLNQGIRLFGLSMTIDNNGNEKVSSLQTTAGSL